MFKGEDIGLDVPDLTDSFENMNLNCWLCKVVQEVANKDDIPLGRLKILSAT